MAQLLQYDPTALVKLPTAGSRENHTGKMLDPGWSPATQSALSRWFSSIPIIRDVGRTIIAISLESEARMNV